MEAPARMIDVNTLLDAILGNLGTLVVLLVIIYGGYKKWWVFGWYAQELKERNNRLETRVDNIGETAKSATKVAEHSVTSLEKKAEAGT